MTDWERLGRQYLDDQRIEFTARQRDVRTPELLKHLLFQRVEIHYGDGEGAIGEITGIVWDGDDIDVELDWGFAIHLSAITQIGQAP